MKKLWILLLVLTFALVGCQDQEEVAQGLEGQLQGVWLMTERHMVIEFDSEENNYVEFKEAYDIDSQVQTRYIRYDVNDEYVLDSEYVNITSFYTHTYDGDECAIENYVVTEGTHYKVEYRDDQVYFVLDEEKSNPELAQVFEINGFTNDVTFDGDTLVMTYELTVDDFGDDPGFAGVKSIKATSRLVPHVKTDFEDQQ